MKNTNIDKFTLKGKAIYLGPHAHPHPPSGDDVIYKQPLIAIVFSNNLFRY